jgi:hypothetical protein
VEVAAGTVMLVLVVVLNPGAVAVRVYVPGGSSGTTYYPVELVVAVRTKPVSALFTVMVALATAASEGSATAPTICPVAEVCPHAEVVTVAAIAATTKERASLRMNR